LDSVLYLNYYSFSNPNPTHLCLNTKPRTLIISFLSVEPILYVD